MCAHVFECALALLHRCALSWSSRPRFNGVRQQARKEQEAMQVNTEQGREQVRYLFLFFRLALDSALRLMPTVVPEVRRICLLLICAFGWWMPARFSSELVIPERHPILRRCLDMCADEKQSARATRAQEQATGGEKVTGGSAFSCGRFTTGPTNTCTLTSTELHAPDACKCKDVQRCERTYHFLPVVSTVCK